MINVLRWIAVLPSACAASMLGYIFAVGINILINAWWLGDGWTTWQDGWSITNIIGFVLSNVALGYGFVFGGVAMAPNYKKQTSIILTVLLSVLLTASVVLGIILYSGWLEGVAAGVITVISAVVACTRTTEEGLELED